MNPATPTLSLCVPTYNRAALLEQALGAILAQIGLEEARQVEVLVLDNASPDRTPDMVEKAGQQWSHIPLRYVRNAENIGPDANFLKAIEMARGTFVYLLSDDDILLPGAVTKLLTLIQAHPDLDGICINSRPFVLSPEEEGDARLDIAEDTTFQNRDEVLHLLRGSIGFLSIMAFRKVRIADRIAAGAYADKVGTYFLQSYLFLDVLSNGNGFAATATPMIAQRAENCTGINYFRVFITEIHALLAYARQIGFSRSVIREIKYENLVATRHFVSRVMIYGRERALWSSRPDAIRRLFRVYGFTPYLWLVVVPLMFFPPPLRPLVLRLRRLLGRPEPLTAAPE